MDPKVAKVEATMRLIGATWVPAIMYVLLIDGPHRFSELRRAIPEVTQRMLTKQLRDLADAGLVHREHHPTIPPRVVYSATELGHSLAPIYADICAWAEAHPGTVSPRSRNGS